MSQEQELAVTEQQGTCTDVKKTRFSKKTSSAMQRYLAEEKAYKASQRQWSKPSHVFKCANPRERPEHRSPSVDLAYNVNNGTIDFQSKKASRRPSAAFLSKSPQRSPSPRSVLNDGESTESQAVHTHSMKPERRHIVTPANTAFRSTSPRLPEPHKLDVGQLQFSSIRPTKSPSRGAVGLISKSPRFQKEAPPLCDAVYNVDKQAWRKKGASTWSISKSPQRPAVVGAAPKANDAKEQPLPTSSPRCLTDISAAIRKRNGSACVFHSLTPRFAGTRSTTPPPGAYASKYISHGMVA